MVWFEHPAGCIGEWRLQPIVRADCYGPTIPLVEALAGNGSPVMPDEAPEAEPESEPPPAEFQPVTVPTVTPGQGQYVFDVGCVAADVQLSLF